jgi:hypothetical protein
VPYVSCVIVAVGMLIHFGIHLIGFLRRRVKAPAAAPVAAPRVRTPRAEPVQGGVA